MWPVEAPMRPSPNLLTRGNGKLGEGIHAWSLPPVETCPGRSALCERVCYARSGRFRTRSMIERLNNNLTAAMQDDFADRVAAEIRRRGVRTLRVHVSGDFFNENYVDQWANIARRSPRTTLYGYTRSWRDPAVAATLVEFATLKNVRLWYSVDSETGLPTVIPPGVRVAYLQTDQSDTPSGGVVFRVRELRRERAERFPLRLVCPTERNPSQGDQVTCTSCRRCHT